MFPAQFVQAAVVLLTLALLVFVIEYTRLTRGANLRDPIGFTLTVEAVLLIPDEIVALFRWFGPLTPGWLSWEIDVQSSTVMLIGLLLAWRTWVFERVHARGYPGLRAGRHEDGNGA